MAKAKSKTEYRLAPRARRDLQDIWLNTRQNWSIEQADSYTDALTTAFEALAQSPKSAPACDHIRTGYRHRSVEHHVIYFRITLNGIAIIRILHERMDAARHL
jgi:toxin ParE1/3/4